MKKFKSILALTASVLALSAFAAPVSAFATEIDQTTNPGSGTQTATHDETVSYTVTIPASVTINQRSGDNYVNADPVSVSAKYKLGVGDTLVVGASSTEQKLTHTDGNTKVPYTAKIGQNSIFGTNTVFNIEGAGDAEATDTKQIDYSAAAADFTKVGTYTDTITFTITYTAAAQNP